MILTLSGEVSLIAIEEFSVIQDGGTGPQPTIVSLTQIDSTTIQIILSERIAPGASILLTHTTSQTSVWLGFLPADVDADGASGPDDLLALIDSLSGTGDPPTALDTGGEGLAAGGTPGLWSIDINRSGLAEPADILRTIDLLNGAGSFTVWNGQTLDSDG